jgi:hypothetical protein
MLFVGDSEDRPEKMVTLCKMYLRLKHGEGLPEIESFITDLDHRCAWDQFVDIDDIKDQVLAPLDREFERWCRTRPSA